MSTQTFDIVLIGYSINITAPRKGPRIEVAPLSENRVDTVELAQGDYLPIKQIEDPTLASSYQECTRAPSSSRSTLPSDALVPIA